MFVDSLLAIYELVGFRDGAKVANSHANTGDIGGIILSKNNQLEYLCSGPCKATTTIHAELVPIQHFVTLLIEKKPNKECIVCTDSQILVKLF